MWKITQQSVMLKKPAYRRSKAKYAQIEREREAQRISLFIEYATVTKYEQQ